MRPLLAVFVLLAVGCKKDEPVEVHHVIGSDGKVDAPVATAPLEAPPPKPRQAAPAEPEDCGPSDRPLAWNCPTYSGNATPLATFKATSMETPTVFRVSGKLSDYYNFEYRSSQKSHYSVEVREDPRSFSGRLHVYISRKDPTADALFEVLKDGAPHTLTVELAYNKRSQDTGIARLVRFVCAGWRCPAGS